MNRTNTLHPPIDEAFGAMKKAVANFLGIKRLEAGCDFYDSDASTAPNADKRDYNMGDLQLELLGDMPHASEQYPLPEISCPRREAN